MTKIHLLAWRAPEFDWDGELTVLPSKLTQAAAAVAEVASTTPASWLLFWDPDLGEPDPDALESLVRGRADAWHAGVELGLAGLPDEHDYIHPTWPLAIDPSVGATGVSWRASLQALLVRTSVLAVLEGLDSAFEDRVGCGLELGRRMIDQGAVVFATPALTSGRASSPLVGGGPRAQLTEHDRFLFLRRVFAPKWVLYAGIRRALATRRPDRVAAAVRSSARTHAARARPGVGVVVERPPVALPANPQVSVILPTLGRYELLRPVLTELRRQTISPIEVIVTDQNEPSVREPALYEEFADLSLRVIYQEERGQWLARNAAAAAARGEWLAFIDDDSEIFPDFIEQHLEGLCRYDADLSTGASKAVVGAPVPENYAFFRVADQWDSGNGMCHRSLFERLGLFDQQFDRQRRGDAEFGLRTQLDGGLVIHNPHAIRVHLKAAEGGLRTFGSWDGFRHRDRTAPLPLPSVVYYAKRFHTPRQVREDLLIGLTQAIVPYHLKRRATAGQWAGFVATELVHARSTVRRIKASIAAADAMLAEGPRIPELGPIVDADR